MAPALHQALTDPRERADHLALAMLVALTDHPRQRDHSDQALPPAHTDPQERRDLLDLLIHQTHTDHRRPRDHTDLAVLPALTDHPRRRDPSAQALQAAHTDLSRLKDHPAQAILPVLTAQALRQTHSPHSMLRDHRDLALQATHSDPRRLRDHPAQAVLLVLTAQAPRPTHSPLSKLRDHPVQAVLPIPTAQALQATRSPRRRLRDHPAQALLRDHQAQALQATHSPHSKLKDHLAQAVLPVLTALALLQTHSAHSRLRDLRAQALPTRPMDHPLLRLPLNPMVSHMETSDIKTMIIPSTKTSDMDPTSVNHPTALPSPTSTRAMSSVLLLRAHTAAVNPATVAIMPHLMVDILVLHPLVATVLHLMEATAVVQEALLALDGVALQVLVTEEMPATVALSAPASATDFPTVTEVPLAATDNTDKADMAPRLTLARRTLNMALLLDSETHRATVPLISTRTESMIRITQLISRIRDKTITTLAASTRTEQLIMTRLSIKALSVASTRTRFMTKT